MPDLETWTEGCKDSNCKLFITLFGKEPPLEDLKDNYYEFRNKVADCLQLASEDLDDTEAFEEHYDEVMDLKESNDIMYHAFEAAYEIACGKIDTDDDFYSEYYSENDCMVALMEMQSLHDKIVNMLNAIDLLAVSAGINV